MRYAKSESATCGKKLRESGPRAPMPLAPRFSAHEREGWDRRRRALGKWAGSYRDIRKLLDETTTHAAFYGHFGHGCITLRVSFDCGERTVESTK